jgi:DNA-binding transcriptional ArsR family regulator
MVNIRSSELDLIFYALSDSTRRRILEMLGKKIHSVGELAAPFRMSLAAVSKHIKILEKARLLKRTHEGRIHHCELNQSSFATAEECIRYYQKFWESRLDALALYLEEDQLKQKTETKKEISNASNRRK